MTGGSDKQRADYDRRHGQKEFKIMIPLSLSCWKDVLKKWKKFLKGGK